MRYASTLNKEMRTASSRVLGKGITMMSIQDLEDDKLYQYGTMLGTGKFWKDWIAFEEEVERRLIWGRPAKDLDKTD